MKLVQNFMFEVPLTAVDTSGMLDDGAETMAVVTLNREDAIQLAQALNEALGNQQPAQSGQDILAYYQAMAAQVPHPAPAVDPRLGDWIAAQQQENEDMPAPLPPGTSVQSGGIGVRPV